MLYELAVIVALVLVNGLFAAAEIAIVGMDKTVFAQLLDRGGHGVRAVQTLRGNPERFFATVQVGITVTGATAGAFGGATFAADLEPVLSRMLPLGVYGDEVALALVVVIVSYLSLVLGELVPKSLALRHAARFSVIVGPPLLWISSAARPLVWLLTGSSNVVLRLFGDQTTFSESRLSPEDLHHLVDEAAESGSIHPAAGEIASRALDFAELTAAHMMVPRPRVVAISRRASNEEVQRIALEHSYSRLPVYDESPDDIVGYVMLKDMLALAWEGRLVVLDDLLRPPFFVVKAMRAPDLLQQMRERRTHLAIVVDERGGTAGIVTIEDLLEELVGEIVSEHAQGELEILTRGTDGSVVVQGDVPIRDLNRELELELPEGHGWSTVAGLCMALAGRVPRTGESLVAPDQTRLLIEAASDRAVFRVRIWPGKGGRQEPDAD